MPKPKKLQDGGFVNSKDPNQQPVTNTLDLIGSPSATQLFGSLHPDDLKTTLESMQVMKRPEVNPDEFNIPIQYDPTHEDFDSDLFKGSLGNLQTQHVSGRGDRLEQRAVELFKQGTVRTINGDIENLHDGEGVEADKATWWDRLYGAIFAPQDYDGYLARRTTGYNPLLTTDPDLSGKGAAKHFADILSAGPTGTAGMGVVGAAKGLQFLGSAFGAKDVDPETAQKASYIGRSILFPQVLQKLIDPHTYNGFYPTYDEETGKWILQETALDSEEQFQRVRGALMNPYGHGRNAKGIFAAGIDAFSHTFGGLGADITNFVEISQDLMEGLGNKLSTGTWEQDPAGLSDRIAEQMRINHDFNKNISSAAAQTHGLFSSGESFSEGMGSGIASLLQFWGIGGAISKGTVKIATWGAMKLGRNAAKPKLWGSLIGHLGGGTIINSGEVYRQAKLDGLDDDDAAALGLTVGFINSIIEYGVGSNALANRAMGTPGHNVIANAIKEYAKKMGMKISSVDFLNKATGPILKKVYEGLAKADKFANAPFIALENWGLKNAGKYGQGLATRAARGISSGLEEGTEEFLQYQVIEGAKASYNWMQDMWGDPDKKQGDGLFKLNEYSIKDALEEAALGFILGGGARVITNRAYEPDIMYLISQGHGQEVLNILDKLHAESGLGPYQLKKLKKRITDLTALWNANKNAYSYMSPKGQHLVGQFMLYKQGTEEDIEKYIKKIQAVENDKNLTPANRAKKLEDLKTNLDHKNNLNDLFTDLLEKYADPKTVKDNKLEDIPGVITDGVRLLLRDKTISQAKIRQITQFLTDTSISGKNRLRRLKYFLDKQVEQKKLKKEDADKVYKEGKKQQTQADEYNALKEELQKLIDLENQNINNIDEAIENLIMDNSKWSEYEESVKEAKKTDEEAEAEEGPLSENKTQEKPKKEGVVKREKREKKEAEAETQKRVEAIDKVNQKRFPRAPLFIRWGNDKVSELDPERSVKKDAAGNLIYLLNEKDKNGKPKEVKESEVDFAFYDNSNKNRHINVGGFKTSYWLNVVAASVDEDGNMSTKDNRLPILILTDPDLIDKIELEFIYSKRELANNAIKETNMDINMKGSYIRIRQLNLDGTSEIIGVIRTPSRFYDKKGKLLRGDEISEQFFYDNFKTKRLWTKAQWNEFKENYKTLTNMIEKLERLHPTATEENPAKLDENMFSFKFEANLDNKREKTISRALITDTELAGDHTYDGKYRLYDRLDKRALTIGDSFTADELAELPNFDGRYFALIKKGNVVKWVRIMPKEIGIAEAESKIAALIKGIAGIQKQIDNKEIDEKTAKDRLNLLNQKYKLFIAGAKGLHIDVFADDDLKTGKYQLKYWITHKEKTKIAKDINKILPPDSTADSIINILNAELDKFGLGSLSDKSWKQSISHNIKEVSPNQFESTLNPAKGNWRSPTMMIGPNDSFWEQSESTTPVVKEEVEEEQEEKYARVGVPIRTRPTGDTDATVLTGKEAEAAELTIEKIIKDGIEKGQTVDEIANRILPRYGWNLLEVNTVKNFIEGKVNGAITETFAVWRKPPSVQSDYEKGINELEDLFGEEEKVQEKQYDDKQSRDVDKARAGDVATQQDFEKYGIDWEYKPIYRFVGKSEVDALNNGETIEGKNKEVGVDITISEDPTSGTDIGYRITFKEEGFDQAKPNSRVRMKNEEDGWVPGGYKKDDVLTIEKRNADGTYEIVYDANSEQNDLNRLGVKQRKGDLSKEELSKKAQEYNMSVEDFKLEINKWHLNYNIRFEIAELNNETSEGLRAYTPEDVTIKEIMGRIRKFPERYQKELPFQDIPLETTMKAMMPGDQKLLSLPKGKLRNAVRKDIVDQLVAKFQETIFDNDKGEVIKDIPTRLNYLLDFYIKGITLESFKHELNEDSSHEEIKQVVQDAKFALREKLKLESNKETREQIINEALDRIAFLNETEQAFEEEYYTDYDADFTSYGGVQSLSSIIKIWLGNMSHETKDIFNRTRWQNKEYNIDETIRKTFDGVFLAGFLMKLLSNQYNQENVMSRLEALAPYDDQIMSVLTALQKPVHQELKAKFISNFNKYELAYSIVLHDDINNKATVTNQVTNDGQQQVLYKWKSRHTQNRKAVDKIIKILEEESEYSKEAVSKLIKAFDELGFSIEPATAAYLLGDPHLHKAFPELKILGLSNPTKYFARFDKENIDKNKNVIQLANLAQKFDPSTYESNYLDAKNKPHYKYVAYNYYLEKLRELKRGVQDVDIEEVPKYLNLLDDPDILASLEIMRVGDYKLLKETSGKTNKELTEFERLIMMYSLFSEGYYIPHIIAEKVTAYAIKMPVENYVINGKITEDAIDDAYESLFLREYERNKDPKTRLIPNKKGKINYFGILSILENKIITHPQTDDQIKLTDYLKNQTSLDAIAEKFLKEQVIKPMLAEVANDLYTRAKQLDALKTIDKLRTGKILVGGNISVQNKLGNFAINDFIMTGNFTQLLHGDNNFVDDVDINKRLSGFNAAGPIKGAIDYKYLMINDHILKAFGIEGVTNDAQVIMTDRGFAQRELESGSYTTATQKRAYQKLVKGDPLTEAEQNTLDFNSTKTIYEDGNRYFKKSDNIITAEEAATHPELGRIYKLLNDNNIMYLIADSASKRKTDKGVSADFFKKDQKLNTNLIQTGSLKYERDQVVNKTKSKVGLETVSKIQKQTHDLIGALVPLKNRQLINNINEFNAKQKAAFRKVTNTLLEPENDLLLREIIYRDNVNVRDPQTVELLEVVNGQTYNYNLPRLKALIQRSILNLYNKGALQTTIAGGLATLASGTHYLNPQTGKPLTIRKDADGVPYAEILATRKFFSLTDPSFDNIKNIPSKLLTAFAARVPTQSYHSMLPVVVVGFLPDSKGDTIITPLELPHIAGSDYDLDKLYLHRYASTKIDGKILPVPSSPSLAEYKKYWVNQQSVRIAKEIYDISSDEAMIKLGILTEEGTQPNDMVHPLAAQNQMLDNMLEVFTIEEIKQEMFTPATSGQAKPFLERYGNRKTRKSIFTVTGKLDYNTQNKMGERNISVVAPFNGVASMLTQFQLKTGLPSIKIDGNSYGDYSVTREDDIRFAGPQIKIIEGIRTKQDSLSSLITLFVDNVKLGFAAQLNLDREMTELLGHIIGVGAGQMRGLMLINQPILHHYTTLKNNTSILEGLSIFKQRKVTYNLRKDILSKIKNVKGINLTSELLDKALKSDLIFETVLNKDPKTRTQEEVEYLSVQAAVFLLADQVLLNYEKISEMIPVLSAIKGVKDIKSFDNIRRTLYVPNTQQLIRAHPVYQEVEKTILEIETHLNSKFLDTALVNEIFEEIYGVVTNEHMQNTLRTIQTLKKNPKYKNNIALHNLLRIKETEQGLTLVTDSFSKMSPEVEALIIGQFEDLFAEHKGLSDALLKYLFKANLLEFRAESFIKFLPAETFKKFSVALDKAVLEARQVTSKEKNKNKTRKKKIFEGVQLGELTLEETQDTREAEELKEGSYKINRLVNELKIDEFNSLLTKLEKAGVTVEYKPGHNSFYADGKIQLGELSKNTFLEEAMHAGLDILPKGEKTKLRKDVLAWYKELVKNHGGNNKLEIEQLFNQYNDYYKNEEQAAEEIITHLLRKDNALLEELNNLESPDKQGILESVWNKFIQIIADVLGIELKNNSELAALSNILTPVTRLFTQEGITPARFDPKRMYSLPSSLFDTFILPANAKTVAALATNKSGYHLDFDGRLVPNINHIVNIFEGNKDRGKAVIVQKIPIYNITKEPLNKQNEIAKNLGYKNFADWKINTQSKKEGEFVNGTRPGMIVKLKPFLPKTGQDLISMNTIDPAHNVLNNVLVLLHRQIKDLSGVQDKGFAQRREARLNKLITDIKVAQDVFIAVDVFHDDITLSYELLKQSLAKNPNNEQLIAGLNLFQNLLHDMDFINELPKAFRDKIGKRKRTDIENTKLQKLEDAVTIYNQMKATLNEQYIPAVAEKLFPFVEKSGKNTLKYINEKLRLDNEQMDKIELDEDLSEEEKQKKLKVLKEQGKKYADLLELAPRSVKDLENFFRYTTQDEGYALYLLTAPATTSDPGLGALVNYTFMLHNAIRNEMIQVSDQIEDADSLMKQWWKLQKGRDSNIFDNAAKFYAPIIEIVNNSQTGYKDVWRFVAKIDATLFDTARLEAEDKLRKNEEAMDVLEAKWKQDIMQRITKYKKQLALYTKQEEAEGVADIIANLENMILRNQTLIKEKPTEQELLRFGLRQNNWFKNNTVPKSKEEINKVVARQGVNAKIWARSQMNAKAMFDHNIITKEEYEIIAGVERAIWKTKSLGFMNKPSYFGTLVTRPSDKYINKKWLTLYKKDKDNNWIPKNKLGEAHQKFTEIYEVALNKEGLKRQTIHMMLPSIRKSSIDRVLEKGTVSEIQERISRLFTIDQDDVLAYGVAAVSDQSKKYAPSYFMDQIDANDVSLDVKSSLMLFASRAAVTEKNNELLKTAYLLQDIYNEKRIVDPKAPDKYGVTVFTRKHLNFKDDQSVISKRVEKYIEMVLLGKTKQSQSVTLPGGKVLQIDKVVDTLLSYTAITTLGLDWLKGTRNYWTAIFQQGIEAGANRANKDRLGLEDFYTGQKLMVKSWRSLNEDKYQKLGNRSYVGKMLLKYDALQGNFDDWTGKQTTGSAALRQWFSTDTFLLNYNIGEVQAQGGAALGLLMKRKVVLGGKEMSLYEAYKVNPVDGKLIFKQGTKAEIEKAKKIEVEAINEIREMNRRLNGNYTSMSKSVLSQNAGGRMLELFRKFLVPVLMNRWRGDFINHEIGEVDGGFYRRTMGNMWRAWQTSTEAGIINKLRDSLKRSTVVQQDKEKAMKALHDVVLLAILSSLVAILSIMEDDDDEEFPMAGYYLLYLLTTTRGEIAAFAPWYTMPAEMLRILRSPTAMTTSIERSIKLVRQLLDPTAVYQRDSGVWTKGESKLKARFLQSLGFTGPIFESVQFDPETALKNFRMTQK